MKVSLDCATATTLVLLTAAAPGPDEEKTHFTHCKTWHLLNFPFATLLNFYVPKKICICVPLEIALEFVGLAWEGAAGRVFFRDAVSTDRAVPEQTGI